MEVFTSSQIWWKGLHVYKWACTHITDVTNLPIGRVGNSHSLDNKNSTPPPGWLALHSHFIIIPKSLIIIICPSPSTPLSSTPTVVIAYYLYWTKDRNFQSPKRNPKSSRLVPPFNELLKYICLFNLLSSGKWWPTLKGTSAHLLSQRTFYKNGNALYLHCPYGSTPHMWHLSTWNMASWMNFMNYELWILI